MYQRILLPLVLLSILALLIPASHAEVQGSKPSLFDPSGNFHVIKSQDNNIDSDFIAVIELEKKPGRKQTFYGSLSIAGHGDSITSFKFIALTAIPEKFTFTTNTIKGISYSFSGRFLRRGNYLDDWNRDERPFDQAVMEGALTKFKDGRKVSEKFFKFIYSVGD